MPEARRAGSQPAMAPMPPRTTAAGSPGVPDHMSGQPQLFFDVTAYTVLQIRSTLVLPQ
jgi:hypothetical protein